MSWLSSWPDRPTNGTPWASSSARELLRSASAGLWGSHDPPPPSAAARPAHSRSRLSRPVAATPARLTAAGSWCLRVCRLSGEQQHQKVLTFRMLHPALRPEGLLPGLCRRSAAEPDDLRLPLETPFCVRRLPTRSARRTVFPRLPVRCLSPMGGNRRETLLAAIQSKSISRTGWPPRIKGDH